MCRRNVYPDKGGKKCPEWDYLRFLILLIVLLLSGCVSLIFFQCWFAGFWYQSGCRGLIVWNSAMVRSGFCFNEKKKNNQPTKKPNKKPTRNETNTHKTHKQKTKQMKQSTQPNPQNPREGKIHNMWVSYRDTQENRRFSNYLVRRSLGRSWVRSNTSLTRISSWKGRGVRKKKELLFLLSHK